MGGIWVHFTESFKFRGASSGKFENCSSGFEKGGKYAIRQMHDLAHSFEIYVTSVFTI